MVTKISGDSITIGSTPITASTVGISQADQWRLTSDLSADTDPIANVERVDDSAFDFIGNGMTHSSGIFTFPETGIYLIDFHVKITAVTNDNVVFAISATIDNSTYNIVSQANCSAYNTYDNSASNSYMLDVTDTSNVKVKFLTFSIGSGSYIRGSSSSNLTTMTFIRLGNT